MPDQPTNPQPGNHAPKKSTAYAPVICISTFISLGVLFGVVYHNIPMGICIGIVVGAIFGSFAQSKKAK